MSAHTPGPWVARPDPNGTANDFCIGLNDDCSPIDYVAVCHKRDARLIAAAPEMLSALKKVHAHGYTNGDDWNMVRDAITKATGVEPND